MPTQIFQDNLRISAKDFAQFEKDLTTYLQAVEGYEATLEAISAPYTRGRRF